MEHRWGERVAVRNRVALRAYGGPRGIGYFRDISVSGALLVTGVQAAPMSFVKVFLSAGPDGAPASIEGQVVRHTENGFAIEWCELAPERVLSLLQADKPVAARMASEIPAIVKSASGIRQR